MNFHSTIPNSVLSQTLRADGKNMRNLSVDLKKEIQKYYENNDRKSSIVEHLTSIIKKKQGSGKSVPVADDSKEKHWKTDAYWQLPEHVRTAIDKAQLSSVSFTMILPSHSSHIWDYSTKSKPSKETSAILN